MKKFILKVFSFLFVCILLYLGIFYSLKFNLENKISDSDIIFLGDSHTKYLNLDKSFNYSVNASPYIIHYNFVKTFSNQFNNKKVVIACGLHNTSKLTENRFKGEVFQKGWIEMVNNELNAFSLIEDSYDYNWRNDDNVFASISKNKVSSLYDLNFKKVNNGGFVGNDTISFNKTLNRHFNEKHVHSDTIQKKYLTLLIDLLKKNNCKVILISTPVVDYYLKHVPLSQKENHLKTIEKLQVNYVDLNDLLKEKFDESCFKNADHINIKGDKIVIEYLEKILR